MVVRGDVMPFKASKACILLVGFLGLYTVGYAIARINIFHAVENYPFGKGGSRQDYITKKNHQPGQGWEYQLFLPAIKIEETITYYTHN
mgnify:CR=1 FL=1